MSSGRERYVARAHKERPGSRLGEDTPVAQTLPSIRGRKVAVFKEWRCYAALGWPVRDAAIKHLSAHLIDSPDPRNDKV